MKRNAVRLGGPLVGEDVKVIATVQGNALSHFLNEFLSTPDETIFLDDDRHLAFG